MEDQQVGQDEQYYLLRMLYSDGRVTDRERQFVAELQREFHRAG